MSPILFYGVPSGCSFGSIVALEWLGLPYRLCRIEMPEVATSEAYRRINPVAETPSLLTADGHLLRESLAILNHLGSQATGSDQAFAQGTPEFDRLNQMLAYLNTTYFGAFAPLWYLLEHSIGDAEKQALREYGRALVEKAHADLEAMLGDQPWLLGGQRSLADAYFAGIARWTRYHDDVIDLADYPRLKALYERLQADPAVRFAHAIEHQQAVASAGGFRGEVTLAEALDQLAEATQEPVQ